MSNETSLTRDSATDHHAESILAELLSRSTSAILICDDERRYTQINDAACTLFGRSRQDIIGKRIEELAAPDLCEQTPALFEEFLRVQSLSGEFAVVDAEGRRVSCSYSASAHVLPGLHLSILIPLPETDPDFDAPAGNQVSPPLRLTERERQVLALLALGESNESIARKLHLSAETVRSHTRSARLRLGARSRSHAIALALQSNQLDLGKHV